MKKIILVVIGILVVIAIGVGGVVLGKVYLDDSNRVAIAIHKTIVQPDRLDITGTYQYQFSDGFYDFFKDIAGETLPSDSEDMKEITAYVNQILQSTTFRTHVQVDADQKNMINSDFNYEFGLLYKDETMMDFNMKVKDQMLELGSPSMIDQRVYLSFDELFEKVDMDLDDIDFEAYTQIIMNSKKRFQDVDLKPYIEIYEQYGESGIEKGDVVNVTLENGKSVRCREYIWTYDYNNLMNLIEDLIKTIHDDDNLREAIRLTLLDLCNELKDSKDYRAFDHLTRKDLNDFIETLEDPEDFEDEFDDAMDEFEDLLSEEMEKAEEDLDDQFEKTDIEVKVTYAIDIFNNIRSIKTETKNEFVIVTGETKYNTDFKEIATIDTDDPNTYNIIDIDEYDSQEKDELLNAVLESLNSHLQDNSAVDQLLQDARDNIPLLPLDLQEEFRNYLDPLIDNKDAFLDGIFNQGGE